MGEGPSAGAPGTRGAALVCLSRLLELTPADAAASSAVGSGAIGSGPVTSGRLSFVGLDGRSVVCFDAAAGAEGGAGTTGAFKTGVCAVFTFCA